MPSRRSASPSASPSGAGSRAEHVLGHLDDRRLAAESAHGLRHLHPDRPAPEDQQASRDGLHRGRLTAAPNAVELTQARYGRHDRIGTVGEHDVLGGMAHAVNLDDARARQPSGAAQQVDALIGQPALLPGVGVVGDHEVAPGKRRLDVDLGARGCLARPMDRLARAQQRLRRNARPVGALPAHEFALHNGDPQAALGQRPRAVLARRAAAEHDDVVVGVHFGRTSPA